MKAPERIAVTADHIRCGQRAIPESCPIALALREQIGGDYHVEVLNDNVSILRDDLIDGKITMLYADLPEEAQRFVTAYDTQEPIEPFEFALTWHQTGGTP